MDNFFSQASEKLLRKDVVLRTKLLINNRVFCIGTGWIYKTNTLSINKNDISLAYIRRIGRHSINELEQIRIDANVQGVKELHQLDQICQLTNISL